MFGLKERRTYHASASSRRIAVSAWRTLLLQAQFSTILIRAKRDQHTEYRDRDLVNELAPAMQRLGHVKTHAAGPPATKIPTSPASACQPCSGFGK